MTSIFRPDLIAHRHQLFAVPQPLYYEPAKFAQYWPFVSNIWEQSKAHPRKANGSSQRTNCACRCHHDAKRDRTVAGGAGIRNRGYNELDCNAAIAIIREYRSGDDTEPWRIRIERVKGKEDQSHSHTLDYVDERSSSIGLKDAVQGLFAVTTKPNDILELMREGPDSQAFAEAGARFMDYQRVKYCNVKAVRSKSNIRQSDAASTTT